MGREVAEGDVGCRCAGERQEVAEPGVVPGLPAGAGVGEEHPGEALGHRADLDLGPRAEADLRHTAHPGRDLRDDEPVVPAPEVATGPGREVGVAVGLLRHARANGRPGLSVPRGRVRDMSGWVWALVGLVVGVGVSVVVGRLLHAARSAAVVAERDLLRERVLDLETSLAEDMETAALLAPLKDALVRVEHQVGTLERDRMEQFGSLRALLSRVEGETQHLGRQTASLAGSLRSSTVRGAWGEVQLRRVLEASGMLPRCDFDEQVTAVSAHDRGVRPDVVVRLPGGKVLVVDAKAPMSAFLDAQAEDLPDDERAALLVEHATGLGRHVSALAAKEYWSAFREGPEMVVCFVPSDAMLGAALAAQPALHERALAQRVVLVGPGSLMALLRTVAFTWQQDALSSSARELLDLGRDLHRRLGTLGAHTAKVGRSLQSSVEAYNAMVGALESRVMVTARRMHDLDLVGDELPVLTPVETAPRPLTSQELIDAATAADSRPDLLLDLGLPAPGRGHGIRDAG